MGPVLVLAAALGPAGAVSERGGRPRATGRVVSAGRACVRPTGVRPGRTCRSRPAPAGRPRAGCRKPISVATPWSRPRRRRIVAITVRFGWHLSSGRTWPPRVARPRAHRPVRAPPAQLHRPARPMWSVALPFLARSRGGLGGDHPWPARNGWRCSRSTNAVASLTGRHGPGRDVKLAACWPVPGPGSLESRSSSAPSPGSCSAERSASRCSSGARTAARGPVGPFMLAALNSGAAADPIASCTRRPFFPRPETARAH